MKNKIKIGGVDFALFDYQGAVREIYNKIDGIKKSQVAEGFFVLPFNLRHFQRLKNREETIIQMITKALYVFADGMPIVWASKFKSQSLPARITGCDLGKLLIEKAGDRKVLLLATNDQGLNVGEKAASKFQKKGLRVKGITQPYSLTKKEEMPDKVDKLLKKWRPDIVLVGLGGREQDRWILKNQKKYQIPFCMGVGGTLDIIAGYSKRAPIWMQKIGLEWFYQIMAKPVKIERYLKQFPIFIWLIYQAIKNEG
jgi:N-acetylglucosaminyldiphosphoundecaprenol N-acetyl-beta-D-mannosaminyltransferase